MSQMKKTVGEFMTKKVISVHEDNSLEKALEIMDEHGILGAPVVDGEGKLVGIVTESDLVKPLTTLKQPYALPLLGSLMYLENPQDFNDQLKEHCARKVKDLMTAEVACLRETDTLANAIDTMSERKLSRLPVVDKKGKLTGIVTRSDVVHQLAKMKTI